MAVILGMVTVNNKDILEVDAVPSAGAGTPASVGSFAMYDAAVIEASRFVFSQAGSFYDVVGAAKALQLYNYPAIGHYFWLFVSDGANVQTDPALVGTGHQVSILTADTSAQIATKVFNEINLVSSDFTATNGTASQVDVVNTVGGNVTDASSSGSAAVASTTTQGSESGSHYIKTGAPDTAWDLVLTSSASNNGLGTYLRLPIYDTNATGYHIDDEVAQNGFMIDVAVQAQPTRSAAIEYRIPNPGDAITTVDFVLTQGAQTIAGVKTYSDNAIFNANLTVNGTLTYLNSTNTEITDKLITLNKGGLAASAGGSGLEFEENAVMTGYIKMAADRNGYDFKAANVAFKDDLDLSNLTADRVQKFADTSGTFVMRPDGIPGVANQIGYWQDANNLVSEAGFEYNPTTNTLTVNNVSITNNLTLPGFTLGSVIFAGVAGLLSEDNPNFFWDNTNNRLGLGTAAPSRRLDVKGDSIFRGAIRYADDGAVKANWEVFQSQVSTTNATLTTLATVAVPTNSVMLFTINVVARRTGGTGGTAGDSATYIRTVKARNVAGVLTIPNEQADFTEEDVKAYNVAMSVSGTNLLARVSGVSATNIDWAATYFVQVLS